MRVVFLVCLCVYCVSIGSYVWYVVVVILAVASKYEEFLNRTIKRNNQKLVLLEKVDILYVVEQPFVLPSTRVV